jgi:hypothetical protein
MKKGSGLMDRTIDYIAALAVEFDRERPGYEAEVDGDNYFEAGCAFVCDAVRAIGLDPAEHEDEIAAEIDGIRHESNTAMRVAAEGGGGREELDVADIYLRRLFRPVLRSREQVRRHAQRLTAVRRPLRVRRGRERRVACKTRTRGSRRRTATSRGDPDVGDEPPLHIPLLIGGGR